MHPATESGFTLMEVAVVVAVAGIIAYGGVSGWKAYDERARLIETRAKLDRVEAALTTFSMRHQRLPCADQPGGSGTGDGAEDRTGNGCAASWGLVPWATLGMTQGDARDGFGGRFTYSVDPDLSVSVAAPAAGEPDMPLACDQPTATLPGGWNLRQREASLRVADPTPPPAPPSVDHAAYVLLSHGPNAMGGWSQSGTPRPAPTQTGEAENATGAPAGIWYARVAAGGTGFDDLVRQRTPGRILVDGGCTLQRQPQNVVSAEDLDTGVTAPDTTTPVEPPPPPPPPPPPSGKDPLGKDIKLPSMSQIAKSIDLDKKNNNGGKDSAIDTGLTVITLDDIIIRGSGLISIDLQGQDGLGITGDPKTGSGSDNDLSYTASGEPEWLSFEVPGLARSLDLTLSEFGANEVVLVEFINQGTSIGTLTITGDKKNDNVFKVKDLNIANQSFDSFVISPATPSTRTFVRDFTFKR